MMGQADTDHAFNSIQVGNSDYLSAVTAQREDHDPIGFLLILLNSDSIGAHSEAIRMVKGGDMAWDRRQIIRWSKSECIQSALSEVFRTVPIDPKFEEECALLKVSPGFTAANTGRR